MPSLSRRARPLRDPVVVVAPSSAPSDAELVRRARAGDRWAQEAIFRRYASRVQALAERLLRRRDEADDVVQDTFADALVALDGLREPEALRSWLFGIAVRRVRRRQRKLGLLRVLGLDRSLDDATLSMVAAPGISPEQGSELARLDAILARLDADDRNAWMLRHVEGEKLEDVAAIVGCSLATAKRRIAAAQVHVDAALARGAS
jgi:RNA polymerase sigma-70 factor, ECF subfamily